jgi:hypothetical protein
LEVSAKRKCQVRFQKYVKKIPRLTKKRDPGGCGYRAGIDVRDPKQGVASDILSAERSEREKGKIEGLRLTKSQRDETETLTHSLGD